MTRAILLALAGTLAGCADYAAQRAAVLNGLVGQPESAVVQQLGVPQRVFETPGHRFLAYAQGHTEVFGSPGFFGGGFGYGGFGFGAVSTLPAEVIQRVCETTFDVVGGRVQSWSLHGNACG